MEHCSNKKGTIAACHNTHSSKIVCPVKENCLKRLHMNDSIGMIFSKRQNYSDKEHINGCPWLRLWVLKRHSMRKFF